MPSWMIASRVGAYGIVSVFALLVGGRALAPAFGERCRDHAPASSSIRLAPKNEPGEPLVIEGQVTGADGAPLAGVYLYAFQADANGLYARPTLGSGGSADPRLCGVLHTDDDGRYRIDTVRPSSIRNREGLPPHLSFELWRPGEAPAGAQLLFQVESEEPSPDATALAAAGDRAALQRPIARDADGVWRCVRDFRLR